MFARNTSERYNAGLSFFTKGLVTFFILSALQAILAAVYLALQPTDPKNMFLFGFSRSRVMLLAFFIVYAVIAMILLWVSLKKNTSVGQKVQHISGFWLPTTLLLLGSAAAVWVTWNFLRHPPSPINSYEFARLQPLLIWLLLTAFEAFFLFLSWSSDTLLRTFRNLHARIYRASFQKDIPGLDHRVLNFLVLAVFAVLLGLELPASISQAKMADDTYRGTIPTIGDDCGYQAMAVNLMNGYGYADWVCQPLETYRFDLTSEPGREIQQTYDPENIPAPNATYYRAPGLPLLLSAVYRLFGSQTLTARLTLALMMWLGMVILLLLGWQLAGWVGSLGAGLVGLYTLQHSPMILGYERILTEIPTLFWLHLFALLFILALKYGRRAALAGSGLALGLAALTRSNFMTVIPLVTLLLFYRKQGWRRAVLFLAAGFLPLLLWGVYASHSAGRLILMPAQGASDFPTFNNIDVLEGIGEERLLQGEWNPGFVLNADGELELPSPYRNTPRAGENGYVKGLTFWKDHLSELPRLFYVKLWKNYWYDGYDSGVARRYPIGINLVGIAFVLMSVGFRAGRPLFRWRWLADLRPGGVLLFQFILLAVVALGWRQIPFWSILLIWLLIGLVAVIFPYGNTLISEWQAPLWFLCLLVGHLITTLLYGGARFHFPMDALLTTLALIGVLLTLYHTLKRDLLAAVAAILTLVLAWK